MFENRIWFGTYLVCNPVLIEIPPSKRYVVGVSLGSAKVRAYEASVALITLLDPGTHSSSLYNDKSS